jgi:hypothetical protein
MFVRRLATLAAFAIVLPAHLATAQTLTPATALDGAIGSRLVSDAFTAATAAASSTAAAQGGGGATIAGQRFIPRVFAGLWTSSGTGFQVGAGVTTHPFSEYKHEIQGNLSYLHVEDSNGFGLDVNYIYNFLDTTAGSYTPYAGAGLNLVHFGNSACGDVEDDLDVDLDCGTTDTNLQIGGGLKKPLSGGKEVFGEIWFVLGDFNPIIIRAGLGW